MCYIVIAYSRKICHTKPNVCYCTKSPSFQISNQSTEDDVSFKLLVTQLVFLTARTVRTLIRTFITFIYATMMSSLFVGKENNSFPLKPHKLFAAVRQNIYYCSYMIRYPTSLGHVSTIIHMFMISHNAIIGVKQCR